MLAECSDKSRDFVVDEVVNYSSVFGGDNGTLNGCDKLEPNQNIVSTKEPEKPGQVTVGETRQTVFTWIVQPSSWMNLHR